jgi:hypothetical protein
MQMRLKLFFLVVVVAAWGAPCRGQAPAQQAQDKTIAVFGPTIHYWDGGSGPVVVLVHGLGSSKDGDWGQVVSDSKTAAEQAHAAAEGVKEG